MKDVYMHGDSLPRLQRITLDIHEEITAIIGPSGAGKTSLLNLLVGFEAPDKGSITASLPGDRGSLPLFWVPQDSGLWGHLTALEHLKAVSPPGIREEKLVEILSSFDIGDKGACYPDRLSQGERARLSVARALASGAAVLVMDEVFVSVDPARVGKYWRVVRESLAQTKASLVFSTHSPKAVLGEAELVICLDEGRLLYAGTVEELYWRPESRELAETLGEANWLLPDEAKLWLGREGPEPRCLRPEQIAITPARDGAIVVESSRFHGALAQVRLRHEETGQVRLFHHRPSSDNLRPGERVSIEMRNKE